MKFYRSNMQTEGGVRTSYFKSGQSTEYRVRQTPDTIYNYVPNLLRLWVQKPQ